MRTMIGRIYVRGFRVIAGQLEAKRVTDRLNKVLPEVCVKIAVCHLKDRIARISHFGAVGSIKNDYFIGFYWVYEMLRFSEYFSPIFPI